MNRPQAYTLHLTTSYDTLVPGPCTDTTLLVLSCDGKGIVIRPEALREHTAKAAKAKGGNTMKTRLASGEKNGRKRMATLGAVYDDGQNVRAPQSFDVQYLSNGSWISVPGQTKSPAAPAANAPNEVTFAAVTTSQLRIVFTPQAGKYVGVTELESWCPRAQPVQLVNRNSGLDLGVSGASPTAGAAVVQQTPDGSTNQRWQLEPAQNGYYKIVNLNSGLLLGISGASTTAGADALQWGDNLTPDHLWQVVDAGGGYSKMINKNSGLLLGIQGTSTSPGAAALQWTDNGTADHLWKLVPVS